MANYWQKNLQVNILITTLFLSFSNANANEKCNTCKRDQNGRILRHNSEKLKFKKLNACPSTGKTNGFCPGYVIDHIKPLKRGGLDIPENMQWQTIDEAKLKDKLE